MVESEITRPRKCRYRDRCVLDSAQSFTHVFRSSPSPREDLARSCLSHPLSMLTVNTLIGRSEYQPCVLLQMPVTLSF